MKPKYVAVIPSIYEPYTEACVASCKLENLIVVDNTVNNLGVAASWNVGVRKMYDTGADWTIIISAAVRFGEPGGLDLVDAMAQYAGALCVEGGQYQSSPHPAEGFGWHLIAIHRRTFDDIGLFDENIWPAYVEDTDWHYRVQTFYNDTCPWNVAPLWPRVPVDGDLVDKGHGVDKGGVRIQNHGQMEHYINKWGGRPTEELWVHPFNNPDNPISYWPTPAPRDMSPRVWRWRGRSPIV